MEKTDTLGIYVHIPYCLRKCNYCDFVSFPLQESSESPDSYANRICAEIEEKSKQYADRYIVDTIFFGGGTPTCIGSDLIGRMLLSIKRSFRVCEDAEISIEANPETVSENKAEALFSLGFNRVSIGVQSLNDDVLRLLGRVHSAEKARASYRIFRDAGFKNINMDLMLGVPDQSFEIFKDSLDEMISMRPEHLSFYGLQIEEGTPFYEAYKKDEISIPGWEENRRMYHYAVEKLKTSGYHHYEVSNAALPGCECRHNLKYWTMKPYLGFGTSAHSFIDGKRTDDENPDLVTDWLFTGLRLVDGTDFGRGICESYADVISEMTASGYLIREGTLLRFSEKGLDNTNVVLEKFLNKDHN